MECLAYVTCSRGGLGVDVVARGLVVVAHNGAVADRVGRHRVAGKADGGGGVDRGSHDRCGNDGIVVDWIWVDRHDGAGCWVCERGGASLVRPGVVREALRRDKVLAGGVVVAVHVAPARPSAVHGEAVALHHPGAVQKGEGGALAAQVHEGRGRLLHREGGGGGGETEQGEEDGLHATGCSVATLMLCPGPELLIRPRERNHGGGGLPRAAQTVRLLRATRVGFA